MEILQGFRPLNLAAGTRGSPGFYCNASGGHDDNLITLRTVESGMDQLDRLAQGPRHRGSDA